jgi:hypothetical protein
MRTNTHREWIRISRPVPRGKTEKYRAPKHMATIVLLISAFILSGCATGPLFRANFDADAVGAQPNTSPPGAPVGDFIYLSDPTGTPGQVTVVNSSALSSKSLQYSNIDIPVYYRYVGFMATEEVLGAQQKFRAMWNGRLDLANNSSALDIWLGDGHFSSLAAIRFKNGQVLLRTSDTPTYETIGSYSESQNHVVTITIDKATQKYSIVMIPGSVLSGWKPVLHTAALSTDRPTIYFHFSENASSSGKYVVDNVLIEKVD